MGNSIKPHIDNAEKSGVCQLKGMKLDEWPSELDKLTKNLRTLDLSSNRIAAAPPGLANFAVMKTLTLSHNRLASVPSEIGQMKKLETLSLDNNRLTSLPSSLSSLANLRTAQLAHNSLTTFPLQLCGLKHLDMLDLSHNHISCVPDGVEGLYTIELNLNQNQVASLSTSLCKCPRLKVLRVEENCLELSALSPALLRDSQVSLFAIDGNLFQTRDFNHIEGYDQYMERFSATKKKFM